MAFLVYGLILSDFAASEAYGTHGEWLREFLVAVKKAAQQGPAWPTYPQAVQRHIEAIQYHAEEMIAATETADRTKAEEQNEQVFALLRRGLDQRYFTNTDVTSLVQVLKRYLSAASNYSH